jgi:hypothetical protein
MLYLKERALSFELIFFTIFIHFCLFIFFSFARSSGWSKLSEKYKNKENFDGVIIKNITANFKSNNYSNGILNIGVNDQFIHLSINPFFKLFTPNLLVPLDDVSFSNESRNLVFKFKIGFKEYPGIFVCITKRNAKKLGIEV